MRWFSRRRGGAPQSDVKSAPPAAPARESALPRSGEPLPEALQRLAHDDAIPDELIEWFEAELALEAAAAGGGVPPALDLRELRVRVDGMPDWWAAGGNILLAAPDAAPVVPEISLIPQHPTNCITILGDGARVRQLVFMGDRGMIVVGRTVNFWGISLAAIGSATIMIGENSSATFDGSLDARNGGSIYVGADGMWGAGIRIITDDMHAIRDRSTGERLNMRGGRITIEPHVWLAEQVRIMGQCRIGEGSVVGMGSLVTGRDLPGHSVCVGRPAKPVRDNICWSRDDAS